MKPRTLGYASRFESLLDGFVSLLLRGQRADKILVIARAASPSRLPKKINFCQIDNFVSACAQDSFEYEQSRAGRLRGGDCRRL